MQAQIPACHNSEGRPVKNGDAILTNSGNVNRGAPKTKQGHTGGWQLPESRRGSDADRTAVAMMLHTNLCCSRVGPRAWSRD